MKAYITLLGIFMLFVGCNTATKIENPKNKIENTLTISSCKPYNDYNKQKAIAWENNDVNSEFDMFIGVGRVGRVGWYCGVMEYAYTAYLYEKQPEQVPLSIGVINNANIGFVSLISGEKVAFIHFDYDYTIVLESPIDDYGYTFSYMLKRILFRTGFESYDSSDDVYKMRLVDLYEKSKDDFSKYIGKNLDEQISPYTEDKCSRKNKKNALGYIYRTDNEKLYKNITNMLIRNDDYSLRRLKDDYEKNPIVFCGEPVAFGEVLNYSWDDDSFLWNDFGIFHDDQSILFGMIALGNERSFKFLIDNGFEVDLDYKTEIGDNYSYAGKYSLLTFAKLVLKDAEQRNDVRKIENLKIMIKIINDIKDSQ